jgi:hypothetical protein
MAEPAAAAMIPNLLVKPSLLSGVFTSMDLFVFKF